MTLFPEYSSQETQTITADLFTAQSVMAISTVDANGNPWTVCVNASFDINDQLSVIWKSDKAAEHSVNISHNPTISICLFDVESHTGFYARAIAHEVMDHGELAHCLDIRFSRKGKSLPPIEEFSGNSSNRIYRATITEAWVNGKDHTKTKIDINSFVQALRIATSN